LLCFSSPRHFTPLAPRMKSPFASLFFPPPFCFSDFRSCSMSDLPSFVNLSSDGLRTVAPEIIQTFCPFPNISPGSRYLFFPTCRRKSFCLSPFFPGRFSRGFSSLLLARMRTLFVFVSVFYYLNRSPPRLLTLPRPFVEWAFPAQKINFVSFPFEIFSLPQSFLVTPVPHASQIGPVLSMVPDIFPGVPLSVRRLSFRLYSCNTQTNP